MLLFIAALIGGALNAVAGGGSFIALPALLSAGVPPVVANATTTLAMWPGSVSSAVAYRREIASVRSWLLPLAAVSAVGGMLGGWLLVQTSDALFLRLLPWLMFSAAVMFTFGGRLGPFDAQVRADVRVPTFPRRSAPAHSAFQVPVWILVFQSLVAIYGGYFGGGMGIIMLAALSVVRIGDMHAMNGVKAILAVVINGVALAEFVATGTVAWRQGLVMAVGGSVGGFGGAALARAVDPRHVRTFVVAVAWTMTLYFFLR